VSIANSPAVQEKALSEIEKKIVDLNETASEQGSTLETLKAQNKEMRLSFDANQHNMDRIQEGIARGGNRTFINTGTDWNTTSDVIGMTSSGGSKLIFPSQSKTDRVYTECHTSHNGVDYRGTRSTTLSGISCQKWTEQTPHQHTVTPDSYANHGIGEHNYCRNPDDKPAPWCYTTDPNTEWEFCDATNSLQTSCQNGTEELKPGTVYTRWGRTSCPGSAELVYHGFTGGGMYNKEGNGYNYLCLPKVPIYDNPVAGVQTVRSYLYSTEYQTSDGPFSSLYDHDVPCAVCLVRGRFNTIMYPADSNCPTSEFTREYFGFLMTMRSLTSSTEWQNTDYICVDRDPEALPGTSGSTDGNLVYYAAAKCLGGGGIPCAPYIDDEILSCAVCTL